MDLSKKDEWGWGLPDLSKVAHVLAAKALMVPHGVQSRWDTTPSFVYELVTSDVAAPVS
jgi:hypothetical protein